MIQINNLHTGFKSPSIKSINNVKDLKVVSYEEFNDEGNKVNIDYVEFMVIGENREWIDAIPVNDFKKINPDIKVKGLN